MSVISLDKYIFAVGGRDNNSQISSNVQKYSIETDMCSSVSPMNTRRSSLAIMALGKYVST